MLKKIFFILLIVNSLPACKNSFARQDSYRFRHLGQKEGLSQSSVFCFLTDQRGFGWVGTADGLNRYDGNEFRIYRNKTGDSSSLASNRILDLCEDRNGNIWVATDRGMDCFDFASETFRHFSRDETGTAIGRVNSIFEDSKGRIWVSTLSQGFKEFLPATGTFRSYARSEDEKGSIRFAALYHIAEDPKTGFLWIGSGGGGVFRLNPETDEYKNFRHDPDNSNSLSTNLTGKLYFDRSGRLWIGTYGGGLNLYLPEKNQWENFKHDPENSSSLIHDNIDRVFEDSRGQIWIGTEGGLDLVAEQPDGSISFRHFRHNPADPFSISNNHVLEIQEDKAGILWIGTYNGGLNNFDLYPKPFGHLRHIPGETSSLPFPGIRSIFEDREGFLWVSTTQGGLARSQTNKPENRKFYTFRNRPDDTTSFSSNQGNSLFQDRFGTIWAGTNGKGINRLIPLPDKNGRPNYRFEQHHFFTEDSIPVFDDKIRIIFGDSKQRMWIATLNRFLLFDPETGQTLKTYKGGKRNGKTMSAAPIRGIAEDKNGRFWLATDGGGLNLFDPEKETFKYYEKEQGLSGQRAFSICIGRDGTVWVGTSNGLNALNPETGKIKIFTYSEGLPNNVIYGILEDNSGRLWLSTNSGISCFDPKENTFTNYGFRDGLQADEFNLNASFKSAKTAEFFFGGIKGVNHFFPDSIRNNDFVSPVQLTDFKLFNKPIRTYGPDSILHENIALTKEITLDYTDYLFSFDFASLHFNAPENCRYKYMLENFDEDWIYTGSKRAVAVFTNIPAGEYILKVRGTNSDGVWNPNGPNLRIIIRPPFWQKWWFILLIFIAIAGSLALWFYRRETARKMRRVKLEKTVSERTAEVVEQKEVIELKNKNITDSIMYARKIQQAILPPHAAVKEILPESLIFYRPRDIVSGDFYWLGELKDRIVLIVADCTGHGVPGAFMSLISHNLLNQIVKTEGISEPDKILSRLHRDVMRSLNQRTSQNYDSLEAGICTIIPQEKRLIYAGAGIALLIINPDSVLHIKGKRCSIGGAQNKDILEFEGRSFDISRRQAFCMSSDGFRDQFGADNLKRMGSAKYRKVMAEICQSDHNYRERRDMVRRAFADWRGRTDQLDDVLVTAFSFGDESMEAFENRRLK